MSLLDDARIVDLYLMRDEDAIAQSAAKYGARLRSIAYGIVKDAPSAEECESDTYLKAWNSIPPHEPRDYFYAFLARIVRRLSLNVCRDRSRLKRSAHIMELSSELETCIPSQNGVEAELEDSALSEAINSFLARLDGTRRNIFVRRYWFCDSVSDIAKRYNISESKVKSDLFRCRNKLKEHLEREGHNL